MRSRKINIFSLVELIIIFVILTLVFTITIGAANRKLQNNSDICKEHLNKISMAQAMYAADNNDCMAIKLFQLNSYLGFKKYDIPDVTGCPAVPKSLKRKRYYASEYGKNGYIFLKRKTFSSNGDPNEIKCNVNLYKSPEKTMLYMDFPPEPTGGYGAVFPSAKWIKNGDKKAFRHSGKVNCLYIDGHIEKLMPKFNKKRIFWGY